MEDLKQDINTVIAKNYADDSVTLFFQKYNFLKVFEILHHEGKDINEQFMNRLINFFTTIFRFDKLADLFLFDNSTSGKQLLVYVLTHKSPEIRQLIPLAIRSHTSRVTAMLAQSDDAVFEEYMGTIFRLVDDDETSVGLKALDIVRKIAQESRQYEFSIVKRPIFVSYLEKGLKHSNSVVMMRYFDLLIEVTNLSEEIFNSFKEKGLMDLLVETYNTDDILVKLTIVEAVPKMGDSAWNSQFVNTTLVQKSMLDECFDETSDFYVRKNLAILIAKLIARGIISVNLKMKQNFATMCGAWLASGYKEELYGVLDVIASLCVRQSGVEIIFSNEQLLVLFIKLALNTDQAVKIKFLHAYAQIFSEEMDNNKLSAYLKKALAIVGHIEDILKLKKPTNEIKTNSFDKTYKWLLKTVMVPFVDIEQQGLVVLRNVLRHEWALMDFAKQENALTYLLEYSAKSNEVLTLKKEITKIIIEKIDESETKDIFLLDFKNKLVSGKLKGPGDKTSYETEVL